MNGVSGAFVQRHHIRLKLRARKAPTYSTIDRSTFVAPKKMVSPFAFNPSTSSSNPTMNVVDVSKRVESLERTSKMMRDAAKAQTEQLLKLKEALESSKTEMLKMVDETTDRLTDRAIASTHEAMLPKQ